MVGEKEEELTATQALAAEAAEAEEQAKVASEAVHTNQMEMEESLAQLERSKKEAEQNVQRHAARGEQIKQQAMAAQKEVKRARKQCAEAVEDVTVAEQQKAATEVEYQRNISLMESSKDSAVPR